MKITFEQALNFANNCNINDNSDWRLPSIQDWATLLCYRHNETDLCIFNLKEEEYWSSTQYIGDVDRAWAIDVYENRIDYFNINNTFSAIYVRGGEYDKFGNLIVHSLEDGQESFVKTDRTVIDNTTGLEWTLL